MDRHKISFGVVIGICVLIFIGVIFGKSLSMKQEKWFMSECIKDHQEYECVAMWRGARYR